MKNFKKTFLFASVLCFGLGMASCSDEISQVGGGTINDPEDENLRLGYYAPQISMPGDGMTKADPEAKTETGEDNENKVNSIRLVYYNASTGIAEYTFQYDSIHTAGQDFKGDDMRKAGSGYAPTAEYFTPKVEQIAINKYGYKLLVIVNPSDAIKNLTKGKKGTEQNGVANTIADVRKAVSKVKDLKDFIGEGGSSSQDAKMAENFLMTNFRGFINIDTARIKPTEDEAYAASDRSENLVPVDRAVAKVTFEVGNELDKNSKAAISDIKWGLDYTNRESYWIRNQGPEGIPTPKMKKIGSDSTENVVPEDPAISTKYRQLLYAVDPNFTGISHDAPNSSSNVTLSDIFNIIKSDADIDNNGDKKGYEYVLENTMDAPEQYEDVTTAIVMKLKYIPEKTSLGNDLQGAQTYYTWNGYLFTAAEMDSIKTFDMNNVPDEQKAAHAMFADLHQYIVDNADTLKTAFGENFDNPGGSSKACRDISYNADGVNYYRILIRHYGDDLESRTMQYGRFGVVRNNVYNLTLTSVAGPGSITIPKPEGPDDKKQNIAVKIQVLPWVIRSQSVIVGDN